MITTPTARFLSALEGSHERRLRITLMLRDAQGLWYEPGQAGVVNGTLSLDGSAASWRRLSAELTVPPEWTSAAESSTFNGELRVEMGIGFGGVENLLTVNQASAETSIDGLFATNACTIARVTGDADDGNAAIQGTATTTAAMGFGTSRSASSQHRVLVQPGVTYTAVVSAKSATALAGCQLIFWTAAGGVADSRIGTTVACPTWTTLPAVTLTAPPTAAYASVEVYIPGTYAIGTTVMADCFGLWAGMGGEWALPGTAVDWVQVAQLRIEEWQRTSDKATRTFLAYDRAMRVADFPFVTPYTPRDMAGTRLTVVEGIKDIIRTAFPSHDPPVFVVDPRLNTAFLPPEETTFTGARWDAVTTLAQSIAATVYNDHLGRFIIDQLLILDAPVAQVTGGTGGRATMVSQDYQHTRVNQHNAVGMTCESPNGDGIFVYVVDNDPLSPTYYDGPFGRKPFMTRNDTITDVDMAIAAAKALLAQKKSGAADMEVSTIYHPLLQPRDVLSIRRVDTSAFESQVIDSIELSLTKATMSIKTHKWTPEPDISPTIARVGGRSVIPDGS